MVANKLFGMNAAIMILISFASAYSDTFSADIETLGTEPPKEITPNTISYFMCSNHNSDISVKQKGEEMKGGKKT